MKEYPNTEDKDNWSVFFFWCPSEKAQEIIVSLFKTVRKIIPNSLPNYTMREWSKNSIRMSFRVLRNKNQRKAVETLESSITELLRSEGIEPIVNPTGNDQKISGWSNGAPLRKCIAYNRLSKFVVQLGAEGLFQFDDRNEMRHLAINMLSMREAALSSQQFSPFVDLLSGKIALQPFPYPLTQTDLLRGRIEL